MIMSQRGRIRNIAHGLLGTFVSRYNDIDGYWGIGILRLFAEQNGLSKVDIDVTNPPIPFERGTPVSIIEEKYQRWLRNALVREKIDPESVTGAKIELRFSTFEEFPNIIRDTRGQPYVCTVRIARANGNTYEAEHIACYGAHDPTKESRNL